ncbi:sulfatase [Rubritalea marina]|uniref:sulfatase n=1 Tax=Rubritalea marina TaxID=361055 RepID=UPI0005248422|nr:sulfatase [Rubritalea marina]
MKHLLLLFSFVLTGYCLATEKPNIIYINADDLGVMDVAFMGDTRYHTPNLSRLAKQGMVFTEAYAPSANCAPSRAACLSGQAAPRTGVYTVGTSERGKKATRKLIPTPNTTHLDNDCVTLADEMKAAGYLTCQIGKWHVGKDPEKQGIDINIAGAHWGTPPGGYYPPYKNKHLKDGPADEYLTDRLTNEAIQFLTKHKDQSFFLYLPYYSVHTPIQGRRDLLKNYPELKGVQRQYAAMVEALDENIGRLLDTLDTLKLSDNTLLVFSSDNGGITKFSSQAPLRSGKGAYYEGGIRVPVVMRWPNEIPANTTCDVPITGLDFYPTMVHAVGGTPKPGKPIDGTNLMPLMTQSGSIPNRALYWHFPIYLEKYSDEDGGRDPLFRTRPGSVIRYGKWKMHQYFEDGGIELYDLSADQGESNNLAQQMPEKTEELMGMLQNWRKKLHAPIPTELNPSYDQRTAPKTAN